jgi:hypothetical protein
MLKSRRAMQRAMVLRSSAPFSPLPPATYLSFSQQFAHNLDSGDYLKPKVESQEGAPPNPFEGGQMDGMMDGMKKQAVMM